MYSKLRLGLVLDHDFHEQNRRVSALTPRLVDFLQERFDCFWIQNQKDYEDILGNLDALLSMEPGWAAPRLSLVRSSSLREKLACIPSYIMYSDPHDNQWREDYFLQNGFDFILAYFYAPTRHHFRRVPAKCIIHYPWSIPDEWISIETITFRNQKHIAIFGASQHEAYSLRNWCRTFPFVESLANSGVENKLMSDEAYMKWLRTWDAAIAAVSDNPDYRLTTPKYFEIPAAGSLLFAQETDDLHRLGFRHMENCIIFNRSNFVRLACEYMANSSDYITIREAGRELIRSRHRMSARMDYLEGHIRYTLDKKRQPHVKVTHMKKRNPTMTDSVATTYCDQMDTMEKDTIFTNPAEIYLASADRIDRVLKNLMDLELHQTQEIYNYVSVIGGLSGLNYLTALNPRHIIFFDINETMVEYARLIKALIELSNSPEEFISRIFCRSVYAFLEEIGEEKLTVENQERYLKLSIDHNILQRTLSQLSPELQFSFKTYLTPHLSGVVLEGRRNCRRLLPCWSANRIVPVGAGEDIGIDEEGNRVPNTNTFFYGHGWLESEQSFQKVKSILSRSNVQFVKFDILKGDIRELIDLSGNSALHVSNIDDWFPDAWKECKELWRKELRDLGGRLTIITSHNGLEVLQANPHENALKALLPHVSGKLVEVTHKTPWGFHEIQRINVTADDYLENTYEADTTILHILIGEGLSKETFIAVYQKALQLSRWVVVLEHNRTSKDWDAGKSTSLLDENELQKLLEKASEEKNVRISSAQMVAGERDDRRNQIIVVNTERNRMLIKRRILLIADVPNWIFARHCRTIDRYLGDEFDFTFKVQGQTFNEEDFDLIYPLEWNLVKPEQIGNPSKYITGIRSHIGWPDLPFEEFTKFLSTKFQNVHVVSKRLFDIFRLSLPKIKYISHGVNTEFFKPSTQTDQSGKKLRLGWAGNRQQLSKGFREFVEPLGDLSDVELVFCGYADCNLSMEEMRDFYNSLDAYICTSESEGNNNSLMEAASMERAIVTTDNGTVPEYLQNEVNALIVSRELPAFIEAVERLRDEPELRLRLGKAARRAVINSWQWENRAEDYRRFFRESLQQSLTTQSHQALSQDSLDPIGHIPERSEKTKDDGKIGKIACPSFMHMQLDEREYTKYGEDLFEKGDIDGAAEAFSMAIALNPLYAQAHNNLGVVYWKNGNNHAALECFRKALDLDQDDPDIILNLCNLLISCEKTNEAKHILSTFMSKHPECKAAQDMLDCIKGSGDMSHAHPSGPMVSVIVPTYNRPEMVKESIKSILAQSYQDYEIVVVNDGGQDIESIINDLNRDNGKIAYIRHSRNKGLAAARNTGIMASRGKYIAYLDDDDLYYPEHLETLVNFLEHSDFKVAYTDAYRAHQVEINGEHVVTKRDVPYSSDFDYEKILTDNFIPVLCFMHERSCLEEVGLFDETLKNHEDWDLWIRMSRKFMFAHIKALTCEFSWRTDGTTMTSSTDNEYEQVRQKIREKYRNYIMSYTPEDVAEEKSTVSIIIPVFNQIEFTFRCLKALYQNTPLDRVHEVIVVDNASKDGTHEFLEKACTQYPKLRIITNRENLLFAKACNQGADIAGGDTLVFLNNDTEPLPGWLERALERFESDDSIGVIGSKLLYPDRTVQHCGIQFFRNVNQDYEIWPLHRHLHAPEDDPRVNVSQDVHAVTGACLFIRRDLFKRTGGFEEGYGMYFEDTDLCFKVRRAGKRVVYEPASVVIHHEGKSSPDREVINELNAKAAKLFFRVWKEALHPIELETLIEREDGKYAYLTDDFWPQVNPKEIVHIHHLLSSFPPCYVHFGGSGDALLLLSTFYDRDPEQTIVSISNSTAMMRSFFDAFPKLKKVYFIPFPENYTWHVISRKLFKSYDTCLGLGATPTTDADYREWNADVNIFSSYGIQRRPIWAVNFRKNRLETKQVAIQPRGSLKGMVGSKRNALDTKEWEQLLSFLETKGIRPIIIGTPDEASEYPCLGNAIDRRSYSFSDQMQIIAASDFFIGADSWGKTFSALAGIPTFVFYAMRGEDLKDWVDASDFVFLNPWEEITVVKDLKSFKKSFNESWEARFPAPTDLKIRWEGSQFVHHSLALVNRELCLCLIEKGCEVSIVPYEKDQFSPKENPRFKPIAKRLKKSLSGPADVHVRHQWPPSFIPPSEGHWVIIQPWEFGSIPLEWVRHMAVSVDEVWVPSHYVRDCYIRSGVPSDKVFVVPNGVNTDLFNPDNDPYQLKTGKTYKFLFVGGTIPRKGIDILLDVYRKTFTSLDDVCLVIKDMGGQSFYKGQTAKDLIEGFRTDPRSPEIEYIEHTLDSREIAQLYRACDCLVHPYRGEGFGLPIAEAMASGLPVIVTGHGAALDFCNEEIAYLIPATEMRLPEKRIGDMETVDFPWLAEPDKKSLAQIMKHVVTHKDEAAAKGRKAAVFIRVNFSWDKSADAVISRIRNLKCKPVARKCIDNGTSPDKFAHDDKSASIVMVTLNRLEHTKSCVESILRHTPELHEIIFVDNGSTDGTVRWISELVGKHPRFKLIENKKSGSFTKACNEGFKAASGDWIVLLENNVEVTDGWLTGMIDHMKTFPNSGMVGPMSNIAPGAQRVKDTGYGNDIALMQSFAQNLRRTHMKEASYEWRLSGFCLLIRREVLEVVGGFDEAFSYGDYEIDDLCLRSTLAGYRHIVAHDVFVHGHGSHALNLKPSNESGCEHFKRKWSRFISPKSNNTPIVMAKNITIQDCIKELLAWGEESFGRNDFEHATRIFERVLSLDPRNVQALNNIGVIQWQLGDTRSAMLTFQNALTSDPKDPDARENLLQAAKETGRYDMITTSLLNILRKTDPSNPAIEKFIDEQQAPSAMLGPHETLCEGSASIAENDVR